MLTACLPRDLLAVRKGTLVVAEHARECGWPACANSDLRSRAFLGAECARRRKTLVGASLEAANAARAFFCPNTIKISAASSGA